MEYDWFFMDVADRYACGEERSHCTNDVWEIIKLLVDNPTGIYKKVYEDFSKKYHLRKYSNKIT